MEISSSSSTFLTFLVGPGELKIIKYIIIIISVSERSKKKRRREKREGRAKLSNPPLYYLLLPSFPHPPNPKKFHKIYSLQFVRRCESGIRSLP